VRRIGEIETRHLDSDYLMLPSGGSFQISIGESITDAITARIGITLDNRHPSVAQLDVLLQFSAEFRTAQVGGERFDRDQPEAA
jgi:hypothetical protein